MADNTDRVNIAIVNNLFVICSKFQGQLYISFRFCKQYHPGGFVYPTSHGITINKQTYLKIIEDSQELQESIFKFVTSGEQFRKEFGSSIIATSVENDENASCETIISFKNEKTGKFVNLTNVEFEGIIEHSDEILREMEQAFPSTENFFFDKMPLVEQKFLLICAYMAKGYAQENIRCLGCSTNKQEKTEHDCQMLDKESRLINLIPGGIKKLCQHKNHVKKLHEMYCKSNNIEIKEYGTASSLIEKYLQRKEGSAHIFDFLLHCLKGNHRNELKKIDDMINSAE